MPLISKRAKKNLFNSVLNWPETLRYPEKKRKKLIPLKEESLNFGFFLFFDSFIREVSGTNFKLFFEFSPNYYEPVETEKNIWETIPVFEIQFFCERGQVTEGKINVISLRIGTVNLGPYTPEGLILNNENRFICWLQIFNFLREIKNQNGMIKLITKPKDLSALLYILKRFINGEGIFLKEDYRKNNRSLSLIKDKK